MNASCPATTHAPLFVSIGAVGVTLDTDDVEVRAAFADLYRDHVTTEPRADAIHMTVRPTRGLWGRSYDIAGDGVVITAGCRKEEVIAYLEWAINHRVIATHPEFIQLHAATVTYGDIGVAFVGPSGAGKSTLAAALVARGWRYLCDEFALVDALTFELHPFPKAICVKSGSFEIAERLGLSLAGRPRAVKACKGEVCYIRPSDIREDAVSDRVPLRLVVFPEYAGCNEPRLFPLTPAKTSFLLAAHVLNQPDFGGELMPKLTRLASDVDGYALESGRIETTCDILEELAKSACDQRKSCSP